MPLLTAADLDARILARLDNNTQLYQQPERYAALTESARVLNILTAFSQITLPASAPTQKNRIWYDVPYGIVSPTRVQIDNRFLQRTSLIQIGRAHKQWVRETTASLRQPITNWVPLGVRKFGIWPADSCPGKIIQITGIAEVPPFVYPTDTIRLSNDLLSAFDLLAVHVLQLKESPKTFSQSSTDYQKFQGMMKRMTYLQGWKAPKYWVAELQQAQNR